MYWSKFGVSAQGAKHPVVEILLVCALKSLLSWIIYVQPKNPFVQDWSLCVDTQKTISYLDHFCARKVGVFASIRNRDLKIKIIKVYHWLKEMISWSFSPDIICTRTQIFPIMILVFKRWIFCAYDLEHRLMDVFCVCTQIFLIIICLQMLDYLRKYIGAWVYSAYSEIPNNDFDRPTLDYLRIWASTS